MSKRTYTDDELIARVWDVEEIKKLANKRVYYQANGWRERELDELWTAQHRDTASYGANTGFYVGLDSVRKWYVGAAATGDGVLFQHPISTGLVELAGDGKTAIFKNTLTTENVVGLLTQELRRQGAVRAINVSVYSNEVPVVGSLLSKRILQATGTGVISRNEAVVQAGEAFDRSL